MSNHFSSLHKTHFFSLDVYDNQHKKYGTFYPGFKFMELPGSTLKVIILPTLISLYNI